MAKARKKRTQMGVRNRNGQRKVHQTLVQKIHIANRAFTRAKAERALAQGMDPTTTEKDDSGKERPIFLEHANYHVRAKAFRKMGSPYPENAAECAKLCASLHIKNPTTTSESV
jgi:hypothetical protein